MGWCVVLVKKDAFGQFIAEVDLIAQLPQQVRVIRASDGPALLKVVHEENALRVPENGSHDLALPCRDAPTAFFYLAASSEPRLHPL